MQLHLNLVPDFIGRADNAMGHHVLLLAPILGAFALGGLITWSAARYQVEVYRKKCAVILNARDEILEYANTLSKLVPQTRAQRSKNNDELNLLQVVGSIKEQLHDIERRVARLELREARPREAIKQSIERSKTSAGEGPKLTDKPNRSDRQDRPARALHLGPAAALVPRAIVGQPKPADLLQRMADIICPDKDRDSIVSFQAEALAVRGPAPALIRPPEAPTGPAWERLT